MFELSGMATPYVDSSNFSDVAAALWRRGKSVKSLSLEEQSEIGKRNENNISPSKREHVNSGYRKLKKTRSASRSGIVGFAVEN